MKLRRRVARLLVLVASAAMLLWALKWVATLWLIQDLF